MGGETRRFIGRTVRFWMSIEYLGRGFFLSLVCFFGKGALLEGLLALYVFLHLAGEHFLAFLWHWEREVYKLRTVVYVVLFVESLRRSE
jgi:hypothetical protein